MSQVRSLADGTQEFDVGTALYRLKARLYPGFPEGYVASLGYNDGVFSFLHFARSGAISRNSLHAENSSLATRQIGIVESVSLGTDLFIAPDTNKIYVSYVAIANACASLKLDEIVIPDIGAIQQRPLFETNCVSPYGTDHAGGRIQQDSSGRMFLTVGDFRRTDLATDENSSFGKILVGRPGGQFSTYSRGHRNPQGLLWDTSTQTLLQTEHGPYGGDEINIIREGQHYGWPHETYGTRAERLADIGVGAYGRHDKYTKPIFSYTPSIGIAQIRKVPADSFEFPNWVGSYLVAGMAPRSLSLMRVVLVQERVVMSEAMRLGRIRDFTIAPTGMIVASRNDGLLIVRRDQEKND